MHAIDYIYRTFPDEALAQDFMETLKHLNFEATLEVYKKPHDPYVGNYVEMTDYIIRVRAEDVSSIDRILARDAEVMAEPENDHYFYTFSDEELMEVLLHRKDWPEDDYAFAQQLLKERKVEYNLADLEAAEEHERAIFMKAKSVALPLLILPFFLPILVFVFPVIPHLPMFLFYLVLALGIVIGANFYRRTKQRDGKTYYYYNRQTRRAGKILIWYSLVISLAFIIYISRLYQIFVEKVF